LQEGTYEVRVTVKDSFSDDVGEDASATYVASPRAAGPGATISPTANPLVALYSAPPSHGSSMHVEFRPSGSGQPWRTTAPLPIAPGKSTNLQVAGLRPDTTYLMR